MVELKPYSHCNPKQSGKEPGPSVKDMKMCSYLQEIFINLVNKYKMDIFLHTDLKRGIINYRKHVQRTQNCIINETGVFGTVRVLCTSACYIV